MALPKKHIKDIQDLLAVTDMEIDKKDTEGILRMKRPQKDATIGIIWDQAYEILRLCILFSLAGDTETKESFKQKIFKANENIEKISSNTWIL